MGNLNDIIQQNNLDIERLKNIQLSNFSYEFESKNANDILNYLNTLDNSINNDNDNIIILCDTSDLSQYQFEVNKNPKYVIYKPKSSGNLSNNFWPYVYRSNIKGNENINLQSDENIKISETHIFSLSELKNNYEEILENYNSNNSGGSQTPNNPGESQDPGNNNPISYWGEQEYNGTIGGFNN